MHWDWRKIMKIKMLDKISTSLITRFWNRGKEVGELMETVQSIYETIKDSMTLPPIMKKAAVGGLALLATGYASAASVDWSVTSNYTISPDNNFISLNYLVSNLSESGDANGMVSFTVEGGSNQGVLNAFNTGGYTGQIFGDYTTFTGSVTNPDGDNTFTLFASYLGDPVEGTVSAFSLGDGAGPVAFNDLTVNYTAVPEMASIGFLFLGAAALGFKRGLHNKEVIGQPETELDMAA